MYVRGIDLEWIEVRSFFVGHFEERTLSRVVILVWVGFNYLVIGVKSWSSF